MRTLIALFATAGVLLGGCSGRIVDLTSAPPVDYLQAVSESGLVANLRAKGSYGSFEISGLKKTTLGEPGDWRTCLRTTKSGRPVYFAVFFAGNVINDTRESVAIDRCEQEQQFMALPPPKQKPKLDQRST